MIEEDEVTGREILKLNGNCVWKIVSALWRRSRWIINAHFEYFPGEESEIGSGWKMSEETI